MSRTTLNIDAPILNDLKRLQKERGQPLGQIVSELLAEPLAAARKARLKTAKFRWETRPMRPRIDLEDKEALYAVLDLREP